jgi:3-methylfumaryl-CoA hydratase
MNAGDPHIPVTELSAPSGRSEIQRDVADAQRIARLAATLDHDVPPWPKGQLPPLGHWLCFQPDTRQRRLGRDGHPQRQTHGLLPDVALPRRMWAGSRIRFVRDIPLGAALTRVSTLAAATAKTGRSGRMLFVTLHHAVHHDEGEAAIVEEQDLVYREAARPGAAPPASPTASPTAADDRDDIERKMTIDSTLLFRYSALTFNSHRIHYDRDYSRDVEGYPGLVVHGPLLATLLLDHLLRQRPASRLQSFDFRAAAPIFDGETIRLGARLNGGEAKLRASGPRGLAMTASARLASP